MTWTADDQGKALAWTIEQRSKCPRCGTYAWEHGTEEHPVDAYEADGWLCHGCELLEVAEERRRDLPSAPGTKLVLYRKDPADGT